MMNPLDRLLQDELNHLLDRIAGDSREGMVAFSAGQRPDLRCLLDEAEGRLALLRRSLLQGYEEWREAIGQCENLWALAALGAGEPSELPESRAA